MNKPVVRWSDVRPGDMLIWNSEHDEGWLVLMIMPASDDDRRVHVKMMKLWKRWREAEELTFIDYHWCSLDAQLLCSWTHVKGDR